MLKRITMYVDASDYKYIESHATHTGYKAEFVRKAIADAVKKDKRKRKEESK